MRGTAHRREAGWGQARMQACTRVREEGGGEENRRECGMRTRMRCEAQNLGRYSPSCMLSRLALRIWNDHSRRI
eukprot:1279870-Pleurochrysis_carterae.AAC.1